jgi:hypothetical protein
LCATICVIRIPALIVGRVCDRGGAGGKDLNNKAAKDKSPEPHRNSALGADERWETAHIVFHLELKLGQL